MSGYPVIILLLKKFIITFFLKSFTKELNCFLGYFFNCLDTLYKEYLKKYTQEIEESENKTTLEEYYIEKKAVKRLCMLNDIYYSDSLFEAALKHSSNNTMFSSYMKVANILIMVSPSKAGALERILSIIFVIASQITLS